MAYPSPNDFHDFTSSSQWDQRLPFPHLDNLQHNPAIAHHYHQHHPTTSDADVCMPSIQVGASNAVGAGPWTVSPFPASSTGGSTPQQRRQEPSPPSSGSGGGKVKSTKSHAKKRPDGHIKRPPNAFMLFRAHIYANKRIPDHFAVKDHRDYSRVVAHMWHNLEEAERKKWYETSEREKEMHRLLHPDYKFSPSAPKKEAKPRRNVAKTVNAPEHCERIADEILKSFGRKGVKSEARATPPSRRRKGKASVSSVDTPATVSSLPLPSLAHPSMLSAVSGMKNAASSSSVRSTESAPHRASSALGSPVDLQLYGSVGTGSPSTDATASKAPPKKAKRAPPRKARSTVSQSQPAARQYGKPMKATRQTSADSRARGKANVQAASEAAEPPSPPDIDTRTKVVQDGDPERRRSYSMSGLYADAASLDADLLSLFQESANTADKTFDRLSLHDHQQAVFGEELFVAWSERLAQSSGLAAATNLLADQFRPAMPLARSFSADENVLTTQSTSLGSVNYHSTGSSPSFADQQDTQPAPSVFSAKRRPERLALTQSNMGGGLPMMSPRSHSVSGPLQSSLRAAFAPAGQMNNSLGPPLANMQERPRTSHAERIWWLGNDDGGPTLVSPMRGSFADARRISLSAGNHHLWSPPPIATTADFRTRMSQLDFPALPTSSTRMSFSFPQTPGTARSGSMLRSMMTANEHRRGSYPPPMYADDDAMADAAGDVAKSQQQQHQGRSDSLDQVMASLLSSSKEDSNRDRLINDAGSAPVASRTRPQAGSAIRSVDLQDAQAAMPEASGLPCTPQRELQDAVADQQSPLPPFRSSVLEMRTASHASHADKGKRKMSIGARYHTSVSSTSASEAARPTLSALASYNSSGSGKSSSTS